MVDHNTDRDQGRPTASCTFARVDGGVRLIKPPPYSAGCGESRIVLRSLGTAGISVVRSLRRSIPVSDAGIAAWLLHAPSEIMSGLALELAEGLCKVLAKTGLDCAVVGPDEVIEEGVGDHDVAVVPCEAASMTALLAEVARLLGVDLAEARLLLRRVPAVLLGGVSLATVRTLRERFTALGAEFDASRPAVARFDVFLGECAPALRARARARLRLATGSATATPTGGGHVLTGLDRQLCGPPDANSAPTWIVIACRRYQCTTCGAILTVVPRGVAPRRHYGHAAIAMALTLWAIADAPEAEVRRQVCARPISDESRGDGRRSGDGRRQRVTRWGARPCRSRTQRRGRRRSRSVARHRRCKARRDGHKRLPEAARCRDGHRGERRRRRRAHRVGSTMAQGAVWHQRPRARRHVTRRG